MWHFDSGWLWGEKKMELGRENLKYFHFIYNIFLYKMQNPTRMNWTEAYCNANRSWLWKVTLWAVFFLLFIYFLHFSNILKWPSITFIIIPLFFKAIHVIGTIMAIFTLEEKLGSSQRGHEGSLISYIYVPSQVKASGLTERLIMYNSRMFWLQQCLWFSPILYWVHESLVIVYIFNICGLLLAMFRKKTFWYSFFFFNFNFWSTFTVLVLFLNLLCPNFFLLLKNLLTLPHLDLLNQPLFLLPSFSFIIFC